MDYIEIYGMMGKSHKHIELQIVKEYLIAEGDKMFNEINREREYAERKGVPSHLISIFCRKLEERRELLNHLLSETQDKIRIQDKTEKEENNEK